MITTRVIPTIDYGVTNDVAWEINAEGTLEAIDEGPDATVITEKMGVGH